MPSHFFYISTLLVKFCINLSTQEAYIDALCQEKSRRNKFRFNNRLLYDNRPEVDLHDSYQFPTFTYLRIYSRPKAT